MRCGAIMLRFSKSPKRKYGTEDIPLEAAVRKFVIGLWYILIPSLPSSVSCQGWTGQSHTVVHEDDGSFLAPARQARIKDVCIANRETKLKSCTVCANTTLPAISVAEFHVLLDTQ